MKRQPFLLATLVLAAACSDVENPDDDHGHDHDHDHGLTTALVLNLTANGSTQTFTWSDAEGDGNPTVEDLVLADGVGTVYDVRIEVLNELEDPIEDVTPEIEELAEEHQFFFTGSALQGPATGTNGDAVLEHAYADSDADGLPVGLDNTFTALVAGSGELMVTLRHLPPENGSATKVPGMAETLASDGWGALGGDNDIQVTFPVTVQ